MSDGITAWHDRNNEKIYRIGVEKIRSKSPEEVYQLMKDLQLDLQVFFDDDVALKRHQFAALNRMKDVLKELV